VLLFFQEGLTCQPCWNQITDLQKHAAQLSAAGISQVISITSDPAGPVTQKARDMGLNIPCAVRPPPCRFAAVPRQRLRDDGHLP
jgi:peroxiredoxin